MIPMADSYQPTYWTNDTTPAVNATNLRKIEKGLADAHGIVNTTLGSTGAVDRVVVNDGAGHYLKIPSLTTAERDGLAAANGMLVYNSTLKCFQARRDGAWVDLHAGTIRDNLSMSGKKIQNLAEPTADTDAATRAYVHAHMGNIPSGAIVQWPAVFPPSGWLECNGDAVNRTTYAALFAVIGTMFGAGDGSTTFNLPDLRGEFVRGWDHGRGVDADRELGTVQGGEIQEHTHNILRNVAGPDGAYINTTAVSWGTNVVADSTYITPTGGTETRPRNVALMHIIKV